LDETWLIFEVVQWFDGA